MTLIANDLAKWPHKADEAAKQRAMQGIESMLKKFSSELSKM